MLGSAHLQFIVHQPFLFSFLSTVYPDCKNDRFAEGNPLGSPVKSSFQGDFMSLPLAKWNLILNAFVWGIWYHLIFPDTYYPYPMGLPNFCYHLAIKKMAINGKIRLVSLVVYNYILPRKTGKYNNLPRCGVSSDLTEHMAHLIQAAVWTAGLDDRLTDSGLISFQLCRHTLRPLV